MSSDNGKYMLFSMPDQGVKHTIAAGNGIIMNFKLNIAETVVPGDFPITFTECDHFWR